VTRAISNADDRENAWTMHVTTEFALNPGKFFPPARINNP